MKKLRDQANIGFHIDEKTIVPNNDYLWADFRGLHEYIKDTAKTVNELIDIIEKQDIEIDKLKRQVSNRIQKIEIVKMLGETQIPRPKKIMQIEKWPESRETTDDI